MTERSHSPVHPGSARFNRPIQRPAGRGSNGSSRRLNAKRGWGGDVASLALIAIAALAYLAPALLHGPSFGPTDLGAQLSLLTQTGGPVHNNINGDLITQSLPWETLDWLQIHHGHLPLWNGFSGNGMPLFLNFESAPFAVPTLVSYLAPLSGAFLIAVTTKLLIAGWGTYVCCRVLRISRIASLLGGVTFMLSGPITGWLGWSASGVFIWCGFIVAGLALCYQGVQTGRGVVLLALSVAAAIYGGFPEAYVLVIVGLLGLGLVPLTAIRRGGADPIRRASARVAAGTLVGVGLAAPLWWPGIAYLRGSARQSIVQAFGLPPSDTPMVLAQGYCGLPTGAHQWFCASNYYETTSYVGPICVVLASIALITLWRRPVVRGLGASAAIVLLVLYTLGPVDPVQALIRYTPLKVVRLDRMLPVLVFLLAVLAAFGLDSAVARLAAGTRQAPLVWTAAGVALILAVLWLLTFVAAAQTASARRHALVWPSVLVAVMVMTWILARQPWTRIQPAVLIGPVLVASQAGFLIGAGSGINSSARAPLPSSAALTQLKQIAGDGLIGIDGGNATCNGAPLATCGFRAWTGAGLYPEMNALLGVAELGVHDPVLPLAYEEGWPVPDAGQHLDRYSDFNFFVPDVNTVALARTYGVDTVLVPPGIELPVGMVQVARLNGVTVLRVPGASRFSIVRGGANEPVTGVSEGGNRYSVDIPGVPATTLSARITAVPGWVATANGKRLPITRTANDLMQIAVPAGATTVNLRYLPASLVAGAYIGADSLVVLGAYLVVAALRRSRAARSRSAS